jgi:hypothetical protein
LATFLEPFAPLFRRATRRRPLERYVTGSPPAPPRQKNCETIARALADTELQQLQHLSMDVTAYPLASIDRCSFRSFRMRSYGSLKPHKSKLFVLGETNSDVISRTSEKPGHLVIRS